MRAPRTLNYFFSNYRFKKSARFAVLPDHMIKYHCLLSSDVSKYEKFLPFNYHYDESICNGYKAIFYFAAYNRMFLTDSSCILSHSIMMTHCSSNCIILLPLPYACITQPDSAQLRVQKIVIIDVPTYLQTSFYKFF